MLKLSVALAVVVLSAGCVSTQSYDPTSITTVEHTDKKSYAIGSLQTAGVGDAIIKVQHFSVKRHGPTAVVADQDTTATSGIYKFTFLKGANLPILRQREIDGGRLWIVPTGQDDYHMQIDGAGKLRPYLLPHAAASQELVLFPLQVVPLNATFSVVAAPSRMSGPDDKDFEIVFSGIDSQAIRLRFRDYLSGGGPGPYEQDLVFPVTEKIIQFRNYEIEVRAVTSGKLEFVVSSDSKSGS